MRFGPVRRIGRDRRDKLAFGFRLAAGLAREVSKFPVA
jgi:hypothetical protein